jgi:hypothetical protein
METLWLISTCFEAQNGIPHSPVKLICLKRGNDLELNLGDLSRSPFPLQVQITLADGRQVDTIVLSDTSHIDGHFEDGMGVQYMLSAIQELNLKK